MAKTLLIADDAAIIRAKIKEAAVGAGWTGGQRPPGYVKRGIGADGRLGTGECGG